MFPADLECFLRSHESIKDACVFSITKNGYDEYLCAWVIVKNEIRLDSPSDFQEEISFMLRSRLHSTRKLFVKIVADFPTNSNGKVVKKDLSRIFKQELYL